MTLINNLTKFEPGTKALSSEVNQNFETLRQGHNDQEAKINSIEAAQSSFIKNDGSVAMTASLNMNSNSITNLNAGTANGNAIEWSQLIKATGNSASSRKLLSLFDTTLKYIDIPTENLPTISNNPADPNNDINITTGWCSDSTKSEIIKLTSSYTKQLDNAWSEGLNCGGLDTGNKQANTWYHVFVISKADGGADVLFSTSVAAPMLPNTYIYKRRIGSLKTDSSGNIVRFKQNGDFFEYIYPINDASLTNPSTRLINVSVPSGIDVGLIHTTYVVCTAGTPSFQGNLVSPSYAGSATGYELFLNVNIVLSTTSKLIITDTAQVKLVTTGSATNSSLGVTTFGYIDFRGKN